MALFLTFPPPSFLIGEPAAPGAAGVDVAIALGPAAGDESVGQGFGVDVRVCLGGPGEVVGAGLPVLGNRFGHTIRRSLGLARERDSFLNRMSLIHVTVVTAPVMAGT
jgi:hypothetical protein